MLITVPIQQYFNSETLISAILILFHAHSLPALEIAQLKFHSLIAISSTFAPSASDFHRQTHDPHFDLDPKLIEYAFPSN